MRRHAKAPSAGSNSSSKGRRKLLAASFLVLLTSLALGVSLAGAIAPTVTIQDAEDVEYTTAAVKGTVDPGDQFTEYHFEAATEADFSNVSAFAGFGAFAENEGVQPVEGNFTELTPGTTYHVRLLASNADGQSEAVAANTFTTKAVSPPTVTIDPVTSVTGTSAHFEGTISPNAPETSPGEFPAAYDVNWRFECTPGCPSSGGHISADGSSHAVSEDVNLEPNVDYEVSLVASNAGGQSSAGPESFATNLVAPQVRALYAGSVDEDSALLGAKINPRNSPASYQFEWGLDESYGNVAPATAAPLGASDNSFHLVSAPIAGLAPGAIYHFRLVATNTDTSEVTNGEDRAFITAELVDSPASCPNAALRIGPAAGLPECRAYERVSPLDKNFTDIVAGSSVLDGDHIAGSAGTSFLPEDPGFAAVTTYLATRGADGWGATSTTVGPFGGATAIDFNDTFTQQIVDADLAVTAEDTDSARDVYIRDASGLHLVSKGSQVAGEAADAIYAGESANGEHIFFQSPGSLEPEDAGRTSGEQLYERVDGTTRVVALDSNEQLIGTEGGVLGAGRTSGAGLPGGAEGGAISPDGTEVVFTSPAPASGDVGEVYVRVNAEDTIHVSASQRTTPGNGTHGVKFQGSGLDPDGSFAKIVFTTAAQLTDGDNDVAEPGINGTGGQDLYSYDLGTGNLTRLTGGPADAWQDATVDQMLGISDDGERVYYIGRGALVPGAVAGERNIYLYDGHSDATRLVATLDPDDPGLSGAQGLLFASSAEVTPDGNVMVFPSRSVLTPFDNVSLGCGFFDGSGQKVPGPCREIYRYEALNDTVACISCNQDAQPPLGESHIRRFDRILRATWINKFASDDGSAVVFESNDSLLPHDTNSKTDVYLWRDGALSMLTGGTNANAATLTGMTGDGRDVFLITYDQLVGSDTDPYADLYDARIGGGFPEPPPPAPGCAGDGCQGPPSSQPSFANPATAALQGQGNLRPPKSRKASGKCKKGKVRKKVNGKRRCARASKRASSKGSR